MPLTRHFKETLSARVRKDAKFRRALLSEAIETFLDGDIETGKSVLRDYINATLGFEVLAKRMKKDSKSVHRMLGPDGNPRAENIFTIFKILQDEDDISLEIRASKRKTA
jgi:DNA-binding phage protein